MLHGIHYRKGCRLLLLLVAMLGLAFPLVDSVWSQDNKEASAKEEKKKRDKKGEKKEKAAVEGEMPPTMAGAIGNVTPVGRGHRELVIPQFDPETGKRVSTIQVSNVTREDEVTLRVQGLDIQEFGPDGEQTTRIEVRSGYFDLTTGILTGDSYSKVSVAGQFEIIGQGLVCDTSTKKADDKQVRSQFGKMMGPVRMTIFGGGKMSLSPGDSTNDNKGSDNPKGSSKGKADGKKK
ncbi:MAG: hypothetical protein O3C21_03165 [Verrucomicrobia bacterium]|nr:hypothetical protein [Verrucomicrobiota bacterium]